jgi:hypothetical protein
LTRSNVMRRASQGKGPLLSVVNRF